MMTDYSQFEDDTELNDLFDDFNNASLNDSVVYYESEDCFELKARQRELADA